MNRFSSEDHAAVSRPRADSCYAPPMQVVTFDAVMTQHTSLSATTWKSAARPVSMSGDDCMVKTLAQQHVRVELVCKLFAAVR